MKYSIRYIFLKLAVAGLFLLTHSSCSKFDEPINSPTSTYDVFWSLIEENYIGFTLKPNLDWYSIDNHFRNQVNNNTSNNELWSIFSSMLDSINDKHIFISNSDKSDVYISGGIGKARMDDVKWLRDYYKSFPFDIDVIKQNYLINPQTSGYNEEEERNILTYGSLANNSYYVHISTFFPANGINKPGDWTSDFEHILKENKHIDKLVIDVRNNSGGLNVNVQQIASLFTNKQLFYSYTVTKTGDAYSDFSNSYDNSVFPDDDFYFNKPIVIISNRASMSNAEWFVYIMSLIENVTIIGDSTAGATLGVNGVDLLPNGWLVQFPRELNYTEKGASFEGVGYAPDILVQNSDEDITNGIDKCIEASMKP